MQHKPERRFIPNSEIPTFLDHPRKVTFFPPSYAELHRLKIQRNLGWLAAGILAAVVLLMMFQ